MLIESAVNASLVVYLVLFTLDQGLCGFFMRKNQIKIYLLFF